jgi:hypothetical protein
MTEPIHFVVVLDLDGGTLAVKNLSSDRQQPPQPIGHALPLELRVEADPTDADNRALILAPKLAPEDTAPPFEPWRARGREVLAVATRITDQALGTQDDTRYLVTLKNVSGHFAAVDICVGARVDPRCGDIATKPLPDGNLILEVRPAAQELRCLRPGDEDVLTFVINTRGPAPGVYPIQIDVRYRLVYWERRDMRSISSHPLTITDRCPAKAKPPCDC